MLRVGSNNVSSEGAPFGAAGLTGVCKSPYQEVQEIAAHSTRLFNCTSLVAYWMQMYWQELRTLLPSSPIFFVSIVLARFQCHMVSALRIATFRQHSLTQLP